MRIIRRILVALHLLVGVGAVGGGLAAIMDPAAPMGLRPADMPGFPFESFLVPGIILFAVIGCLALATLNIEGRWPGTWVARVLRLNQKR